MTYQGRSRGRKVRLRARRDAIVAKHADRVIRRERDGIWRDAWDRSARRMREDMLALTAAGHECTVDVKGVQHITETIDQFPPASDSGAHAFTPPHSPGLYGSSYERIMFRPVEWKLTKKGLGCTSSLRWYTWEPFGRGIEDEKTPIYFRSMSKLGAAASTLRMLAEYGAGYGDHTALIGRVLPLVQETYDELRRLLGKFQALPTPEDDRAHAQHIAAGWPWAEIEGG